MSNSRNPYGAAAVRSSIVAFLLGRAVSALLAFVAFALAARLLSLKEYGLYVAALALMEMGLALSSAGLDWVATRIVPDFRVHAGGAATGKLVLRLAALQSLVQAVAGGAVIGAAEVLATLLQLEGAAGPFRLAGALLIIEGMGRLARDQMLGLLMRQSAGQIAQVVRAGTMAGQLGLTLVSGSQLDAVSALRFEITAAAAATLVGTLLLGRVLWQQWTEPPANPDWQAPSLRQLRRLALHTYTSYLLALAYGPQLLTMLIARLLGAEAAAVFGFARGFADQVRRYLPTDLLQSAVRPALVAHYSRSGDFHGLTLRLGLWLKSSLIVLFPLLAFFAAFGALGAAAIGGERFRDTWPVVLVLLCGSGLMAWRRVTELACNTVMAADICVRAALLLILVPPLMAVVLATSHSLIVAVAVVVIAEAVFCLRVMHLLGQRGYSGTWPQSGNKRLLVALGATVLILLAARGLLAPPLAVAIALAALLSLIAIRVCRPLATEEGALLATWNPRLASVAGYRPGVIS